MADQWKVTWDNGANRRPAPNVNNASIPPPLVDNALFDVVEYFTPSGKTVEQERWGKLPDGKWVALTYDSQVRAIFITGEPVPEIQEYILHVKDSVIRKFIPEDE